MKIRLLLFYCLYLLFSLPICHAQFQTQLFSPKPTAGEQYGKNIAIHGEFMFVGATGANNELSKSKPSGAVYVYRKSDSGLTLSQRIIEPDIQTYAQYGFSVDIHGTYAIIGAPGQGNSGAAIIYKFDGESWVRQVSLPAQLSSKFGYSVAITDNYAIVGAINAKGRGQSYSDRGSAWIYKRGIANEVETWTQIAHLTASDEFDRAHFGYRVDINDSIAVVSAYTNAANEDYERSGVYIFENFEDHWFEAKKLHPSDAGVDEREQFGWDISLDGNQIIVGTPNDKISEGKTGSAYIFKKENYVWTEQAKLISTDVSRRFGREVAIMDDFAVIGTLSDNSGAAYIFKRTGESWVEMKKLANPDTYNNGYVNSSFGEAVAISPGYFAVGDYDSSTKASSAGTALVYDKSYFDLVEPMDFKARYEDGKVVLNWIYNSDKDAAFIIERSNDKDFSITQSFNLPANTTFYEDENVKEGLTYFYRLRADNGVIRSLATSAVQVEARKADIITGIEDATENGIHIFPNPATDRIFFQFDDSKITHRLVNLKITSLSGGIVHDANYSKDALRVGVKFPSHLSGMYILSVNTGEKLLKKKLLINPRRL